MRTKRIAVWMTCLAGLSVLAAAIGDDSTSPPDRGREGPTASSAVTGSERGTVSAQRAAQLSPAPHGLPHAREQVATEPLPTGRARPRPSTEARPVNAVAPLRERPPGLLEAIASMIDTAVPGLPDRTSASHQAASGPDSRAEVLQGSNGPASITETVPLPEAERLDIQRSRAAGAAVATPPAERSVIPRSPETERLFDPQDTQRNGLIILRPVRTADDLPAGVGAVLGEVVDGDEGRGDSYVWWNWSGSVSIPDGPDGAWVGINCSAPSGLPDGAYVTQVTVHHEITHTYIGDLEVKIYNQYTSHEWMVRDNEGGSADNIDETRTEYSLFDGDDPEQDWYYRVRDIYGSDVGTLDVVQLYVYYHWDEGQPDLEPYQPSGWDDELVISNVTGTTSSAGTIYDDDNVYVDWSCLNSGNADAGHFRYGLYLDGTRRYYVDMASLAANHYSYALDTNLGTLSAGWHEFKIVCDYDYEVTESDEGNNQYSRYFYITERTYADLAPYSPPNWNDIIPVGTTQLPAEDDHSHSGPYYSDQTLYFNWGSVNSGDATASGYTVRVEVTGTGGNAWNWSGLATDPGYWTRLSYDQPVGPLSAGSHTFRLWVDYYDNVDESNESNNYYERTITVQTPPQADLSPYQPAHWNDYIPIGITQLAPEDDHSYTGPYYSDQTLYFNWGSVNFGEAAAAGYTVRVEVTGTGGNTWDWSGLTTDVGYWTYLSNDQAVGPLSAGSHTFKLWVDYYNNVDESNESNNYYERTITVEAPPQADLSPYQPPHWNDEIPIGITQLAPEDDHSYNGPYYSDQTLYFNWGSVNFGDAVAAGYTVRVEVTGTGGNTWDWTDLTTDPGYWTHLTTDCPVGPLAQGNHTFKFWVDYGDDVAESNEVNNYYERTITVDARPGWLLLYYFCNGGNLEGGCETKFRSIAQEAASAGFRAYVLWDHIADEDRVFQMKNDADWLNGYVRGTDYWTAVDIGLGAAEMDTGDHQTLDTFVDFVLNREAADHYALILFNHGGGIHPRGAEEISTGICFDGDPDNYLSIEELGQSCAHLDAAIGRDFEVLHLDACLMQMIEVNHEVRNHCDYVVASENIGWTFGAGDGWEWHYLDDIAADTDGLTLATWIASAYFDSFGSGRTISALNETYTNNVSVAVDALAEALISNMRTIRGSLESARNGAQKFAYFDTDNTMTQSNIFLDLKDLCREINEHIVGMAEVNDAATGVINAIGAEGGDFVKWEAHESLGGYDFSAGTFGVSVFFPETTDPGGQPTYHNYVNASGTPSNLAFCAATDWDEFLRAYLEWNVLKITSSGASSVAITTTTDELGQGNGVTPFWRVYEPAANVSLTAPSSAGGVAFARWDRNGSSYSTNETINFSMNDDYDFEAVYQTATCELTMEVSPSGSGTTTPSLGTHTYDCSEMVNVSAFAGDCYEFDHWNGPVAEPYAANTSVEVTEDITVTAVFNSLTPPDPNNAAADPPEICGVGSSTLTASVSGAEIDWYIGSCGGTFVGTGNSVVVSPAATTTYYARARDPSSGCASAGCDQVTAMVAEPGLGDLNCDCSVDTFDIDPFVLVVSGQLSEYYAQYPDCDHMLADVNNDGSVNTFDIDPFVDLLSGG